MTGSGVSTLTRPLEEGVGSRVVLRRTDARGMHLADIDASRVVTSLATTYVEGTRALPVLGDPVPIPVRIGKRATPERHIVRTEALEYFDGSGGIGWRPTPL